MQLLRKSIGYLGVCIIGAVFIAGILAFLVSTYDKETRTHYDFFGRQLVPSPFLMRMFFGQEREWTGWLWFVGDMVIFWGGLALGFTLAGFGFKDVSEKSQVD